MQIIKDNLSYCRNARNDIHLNKCSWYILREPTQSKQTANLYKNSLRVYNEKRICL